MIVVIEVGLKLDALIATINRQFENPTLEDQTTFATIITRQVREMESSLEQFDIIASENLIFVTEEDLENIPIFSHSHEGRSTIHPGSR